MRFESLAYRHNFSLGNFPSQWLPLIHLHDPDLPLFPIYYFHALLDSTRSNPNETDRIFGFVEKLNLDDDGNVTVGIIVNKDLKDPQNIDYERLAINEVKERMDSNQEIFEKIMENTDFKNDVKEWLTKKIYDRFRSSNQQE